MTEFRAYRVAQQGESFVRRVATLTEDSLPAGEVTLEVAYSSLNYKDALSATGNRGVTRRFPHTPGIDAAGVVTHSAVDTFSPGDEVIVTSYDLGMNTPGGFAQRLRVPAAWVVPLPAGLGLREAMVLGTAGFTAALAVGALLRHGLKPEQGKVVVTGASGGVGSLAVALLAKLGFTVVASSGKPGAHEMLERLGASDIIPREALSEPSPKPLLSATYAAAVDTVGGETLSNVVKQLAYGGVAAACGLVAGADLTLTVYPFILRGAALMGIDSAECPMDKRRAVWQKLAGEWCLEGLDVLTKEIGLEGLEDAITEMLAGRAQGRVLVNPNR